MLQCLRHKLNITIDRQFPVLKIVAVILIFHLRLCFPPPPRHLKKMYI